jgi:cytosine permease
MVGGMLGEGLSLGGVLFCVIAGGLILLGCACFMGMQSCRSGLPSTIVSAGGLGGSGARYISALLISITGMGWFGLQAAVCGTSCSIMMAETLGGSVPAWAAALFWGFIMTISAMYGYRILKSFYYIIVPGLVLILVYTFIQIVFLPKNGFMATLLAWRPEQPISYITGITLVVGDWAMGAFTVGDYCRYGKNPRGMALGISIGLMTVVPAVFMGGAIFSILMGSPDITVILNGTGFPAMALIFLIFSAWTLNMMNAYSGGIALSVLLGFPEKHLKLNTALAGIIGTVLGAAGILSRFAYFLSLLSSFVPPVIGVLIGEKIAGMLKQRRSKKAELVIPSKTIRGMGDIGVHMKPDFHIPGIIAYGCGAFTAWLTTAIVPFFIPPLNGIIVAAMVYVILEMVFRGYKKEKDCE